MKPVRSLSFSLPKKRIKLDFDAASDETWWRSSRHQSPIKESSKCPGGTAHLVWEDSDECATIAMSARRFESPNTSQFINLQDEVAREDDKPFVLYDKEDDNHINASHNVLRRDIWEGFDVGKSDDAIATVDGSLDARRSARLVRYEGTVSFRCRFCKHAPVGRRADRHPVYPRSLERIYLANIRFQREHVE